MTKILSKQAEERGKDDLEKLERDNEEDLSAQSESPQEEPSTPKQGWVNFLEGREKNPVLGHYPSRQTN